MKKISTLLLVMLTAVFFGSSSVFAEIYLKCKYPLGASFSSTNFLPSNIEVKKEDFRLNFLILDDENKYKYYMVGNLGKSEVIEINSDNDNLLTLLEIIPGAGVTMTSIEMDTLKTVHSRHSDIFGLFPSQYYGECEVEP